MNDLLLQLRRIQQESGFSPPDDERTQRHHVAHMSEFERCRKRVDLQVKAFRETLRERDELLERKAGTKMTVELNANMREQMKLLKQDVDELAAAAARREEAIHKRTKKTGMSADDQDEIELMAEIVDLAGKHAKECELLRARRFDRYVPDDSDSDAERDSDDELVTELPDVDDNGPLGARFRLLQRQDKELDSGLERVRKGVGVLREMALEISDTADLHGEMLVEIDDKVDRNTTRVTHINERLRSALDNTRTPTRFVIDVVCILVLLTIIGAIFMVVLRFVPAVGNLLNG
mmetsp:Transcript_22377/g.54667  ORF Transcript_22377/g.54667 Transcript_22377/m.54667 type:complete len:292 (-) Transcript_22377:72-947(-)